MRVNVDKVLERDQKLSELDDRADALQAGASQFETSAAKLKRKYWWKNMKVPVFQMFLICLMSSLSQLFVDVYLPPADVGHSDSCSIDHHHHHH